MKHIKFINTPQSYNSEVAFVAHIAEIKSKEELLKQLSQMLKFPEYFGCNWDALSDCLRDFHWIENKEIVLVHDDCPVLMKQDMIIYLQILVNAVIDWKEDEEHSFKIIFPEQCKRIVQHYEQL